MKFAALSTLLIACGPTPNFVTRQGVDVFLEGDVPDLINRTNTSDALDIVIARARELAPKLTREANVHYLIFTFHAKKILITDGGTEALAYDNDGDIHFAAYASRCPYHSLAHEFGHVLKKHGDGEHTDRRFFGAPGCLEQSAKAVIEDEICTREITDESDEQSGPGTINFAE